MVEEEVDGPEDQAHQHKRRGEIDEAALANLVTDRMAGMTVAFENLLGVQLGCVGLRFRGGRQRHGNGCAGGCGRRRCARFAGDFAVEPLHLFLGEGALPAQFVEAIGHGGKQ